MNLNYNYKQEKRKEKKKNFYLFINYFFSSIYFIFIKFGSFII